MTERYEFKGGQVLGVTENERIWHMKEISTLFPPIYRILFEHPEIAKGLYHPNLASMKTISLIKGNEERIPLISAMSSDDKWDPHAISMTIYSPIEEGQSVCEVDFNENLYIEKINFKTGFPTVLETLSLIEDILQNDDRIETIKTMPIEPSFPSGQ